MHSFSVRVEAQPAGKQPDFGANDPAGEMGDFVIDFVGDLGNSSDCQVPKNSAGPPSWRVLHFWVSSLQIG
jgi:hypothetical protein